MASTYDCIIIGAGISGIGVAYHLSQQGYKIVVLEGRSNFGGTWDLFKFPGIRSDSAMYDFAYSFHPWTKFQVFGSAANIMEYLNEVVDTYKLRQYMRFNSKVATANFDSATQHWTLTTHAGDTVSARFVINCTGYFRYDTGFTPDIEGMADFKGDIVHSQKWQPDKHSVAGKRVVVVGSGATAITVVPAIANKGECESLVMLQRSPSYIAPVPASSSGYVGRFFLWLFGNAEWAKRFWFSMSRKQATATNWLMWIFCRAYPDMAKKGMLHMIKDNLSKGKVKEGAMKHFTPNYRPWEQRVCADPDGGFYVAYNEGRFSIVTDHIERFEGAGIRLRSGNLLECDTVMMATGLTLRFGGDVEVTVDGESKAFPEEFLYRRMMLSNLPNLFMAIGYTNASWTLRVDILGGFVCGLLKHMKAKGLGSVCPRPPADLAEKPLLTLESSYIKRHLKDMPKQGAAYPWFTPGTFVGDYWEFQTKSLVDSALHFEVARDQELVAKL